MIKRRCKTFGCANLHSNKSGYCNTCTCKHAGDYTDTRESSNDRGYNYKWRVFSQNYLKQHPTCAICGAPATVTDHRDTPAAIMLDLYGRFDLDPLHYQALCTSCNTRKAKEDQQKVEQYFVRKELGYPRGEGQKTASPPTTAPVRPVNTHGTFHKGVPLDGEEE